MLTSGQLRAARALLRWDQKALARASLVSLPTVKRLELQSGPIHANAVTIAALQRALEEAGIEFILATEDKGPGVRLTSPVGDSRVK